MIFSSLIFLFLFLPACIASVIFMPSVKKQNIMLLAFSLIFYAWGEPVWVVLMVLTGAFAWGMGFIIDKAKSDKSRKIALIAATVVMLGSLFIFKYTNFFITQLNYIPLVNIPLVNIRMPIGISFYTFQVLTYVIDLYRGEVQLQRKLHNFLLYQTLFPQLIAGPIVRYSDVDAQIMDRTLSIRKFTEGSGRFIIGLAKKVLIANRLGQLVESTLAVDNISGLTGLAAWAGLLAWGFQIYFDFSGYSDMAIGLGRIFGFDFRENFNYPYIATSITDFWRRWHISLSSFFRDYVYIPLGGNRHDQIRNMAVVWALTGFWHGASWNFIIWGLYFFGLLVLEKKFLLQYLNRIPRVIGWFYAMFAVLIGWGIFYFTNMGQFFRFTTRLMGFGGWADTSSKTLVSSYIFILIIAALSSLPIVPKVRAWVQRFNDPEYTKPKPKWLQTLESPNVSDGIAIARNSILLLLCVANLVASGFNPFLYFRF